MRSVRTYAVIALLGLSSVAAAQEIKNWPAPKTWAPVSSGRMALTTPTYPPLPFVPVTPCRVIDTRAGSGFPSGYGPPSIAGGGTQRTFVITSQCGIPSDAQAVSFNFAVWAPTTRGDLRVFPAGGVTPTVSTLNWEANILALANAAVVPLGTSGSITVQMDTAAALTDIFVDINGFYGPTPADQQQYFTLNTNSTSYTMRLDNASTTCGGACGVLQTVASGTAIDGQTSSTNATDAGVYGYAFAGFGVEGQTSSKSSDAAGVLGRDGYGAGAQTGFSSAGVRGEGLLGVVGFTNQTNGVGVLGHTNSGVNAIGVYGVGTGSGGIGVYGWGASYGVYAVGNLGASGAKSFVEPHPTDPTMVIRFVALEGPEAGTYFRGTATTVDRRAVIPVPESFRIVTAEEGLTVHLTPVGALAQVAVISRDLNQIVVESSREVTFDYLVHGVRRAFKDWQVVAEGQEYRPTSPDQKMPAAYSEEAKARLIANGTYNADGTVNMATAERLGWAEAWRVQARAATAQPAAVTARP